MGSGARAVISKDRYGSNFSWCTGCAQNSIFCYTNDISGDWDFTTQASALPSIWQHVAFTFDGTTQRLFLDGKLVGTKVAPITDKPSKVSVGSFSRNYPNGNHQEYISDLEVLKGQVLYTGDYTIPTNSLGGKP